MLLLTIFNSSEDTSQGHMFWQEINKEWRFLLDYKLDKRV